MEEDLKWLPLRSSHIQRKNYFYFRASGASADAPLALFHRWGNPFRLAASRQATFPKGTALMVAGNFAAAPKAPPERKDFSRSGGRCRAATKGGIWHRAAMTERVSRPLGEGGCDQREQTEGVPRLRGRISLLFVPNSTFWGENRKRLSKMHKKAAQSLAGTPLTAPGRIFFRNNRAN